MISPRNAIPSISTRALFKERRNEGSEGERDEITLGSAATWTVDRAG